MNKINVSCLRFLVNAYIAIAYLLFQFRIISRMACQKCLHFDMCLVCFFFFTFIAVRTRWLTIFALQPWYTTIQCTCVIKANVGDCWHLCLLSVHMHVWFAHSHWRTQMSICSSSASSDFCGQQKYEKYSKLVASVVFSYFSWFSLLLIAYSKILKILCTHVCGLRVYIPSWLSNTYSWNSIKMQLFIDGYHVFRVGHIIVINWIRQSISSCIYKYCPALVMRYVICLRLNCPLAVVPSSPLLFIIAVADIQLGAQVNIIKKAFSSIEEFDHRWAGQIF